MAPSASDDDKGDKTQFGVARPPQLKRPGKAEQQPAPQSEPSAADRTSHGFAPPPKPPVPPKAPAAVPQSAQLDAEDERTVIVSRKRTTTASLQRLQPPGHSEVVHLDRTSYVVGRSHKCDVALYSPSASREHARLTFRDASWYVQPIGDKSVMADGVTVRDELRLSHKMRLQLGGDELLFFDESAAVASPAKPAAAVQSTHWSFPMLIGIAVAAVLAAVAWWFLSHG